MGKLAKNYKVYAVEEKHRGKWQPLMAEDDKPKMVSITEETADAMNIDQDSQGIRYVEKKGSQKENKKEEKDENEQTDLDVIKARYEEVVGKKPYHKWDIDTLKEKIAEHKE